MSPKNNKNSIPHNLPKIDSSRESTDAGENSKIKMKNKKTRKVRFEI